MTSAKKRKSEEGAEPASSLSEREKKDASSQSVVNEGELRPEEAWSALDDDESREKKCRAGESPSAKSRGPASLVEHEKSRGQVLKRVGAVESLLRSATVIQAQSRLPRHPPGGRIPKGRKGVEYMMTSDRPGAGASTKESALRTCCPEKRHDRPVVGDPALPIEGDSSDPTRPERKQPIP